MKILWFPRLQFDIDRLHITTWKEMCDCLENNGHQVRIAIAGKKIDGVFERDYIPVFTIRRKFLRILTFWFFGLIQFMKHVVLFKPDIIILNIFTIWFSLPLIMLGIKRKTTIVVDHRNPYSRVDKGRLTLQDRLTLIYSSAAIRFCGKYLDGMTVITDYYKNLITRRHRYDRQKIGVWSSGVNTRSFSPEAASPVPAFECFRDRFVVMQHGQISLNRGVFESVEAMTYMDDDAICLVLLGDAIGKDKSLEQLKAYVKNHGLEKRVYLPGPVPYKAVPDYLNYADCGLVAYPDIEYWNLNNPIKLLEYMAMEKVMICTDMWTFKHVLKDSGSVYYLKTNSPEEIAKGIKYFYDNQARLGAWGKEARGIVTSRFTWQMQSEKLMSFCKNLAVE